jgi:hypothetical protein
MMVYEIVHEHTSSHHLLYGLIFENGIYYLKVKYYTQPLHSDDAHSRLKQGSESSKKRNK